MNTSWINNLVIITLTLDCISALWLWNASDTPLSIQERVPGMDGAVAVSSEGGSRTGPEGTLSVFDGVPADHPGSWSRFRGDNFDNISSENFTPAPPGAGFPELWGLDVGEGFAGAAIRNGRVYLLDYDREQKADALRCLSLQDGREIWRYSYPVNIKRNHGMSRTVPFVTDSVVVSIGPKCHVTCLDSVTGKKKWSLDLVQAFGAEVPPGIPDRIP